MVKCVDFMRDQILQYFPKISKDMPSTRSNEVEQNLFTCLAGEFQNPNEDAKTTFETLLGYYWDALTELIMTKAKGKDKVKSLLHQILSTLMH